MNNPSPQPRDASLSRSASPSLQTSIPRCDSPWNRRKNSLGVGHVDETLVGSPIKWLPLKSHPTQKEIITSKPVVPGMQEVKWRYGNSSPSREQSPLGASSASKHQEGLPQKRKGSLADLGLDLMTTVQEISMDSPTIPGHPPMSRKFKQCNRLPPSRPCPQPPQSQITQELQEGDPSPYLVPRSVFSDQVGVKRASSVLLPNGLAPLVIPDSSMNVQPQQTHKSQLLSTDNEDVPPKVPPKSPKTLIRAFPQPRKIRETPTSATSPFSALPTANSSMTSINTIDSRNSPKPWTSPIRGRSPLGNQSLINAREVPPGLPIRKQSEPTLGYEKATIHHNNTQLEGIRGRSVTGTGHQRAESEASILNRARRIMRRGDTALQRNLSRTLRLQDSAGSLTQALPQGIHVGIARDEMTACEIRRLKQLAQLSVKGFKVLKETDVLSLTMEMRELHERCEFLKGIHLSLRQSRIDLHGRMVGVLKSPRTATFSREHLVRQEEALLDLDISINEWLVKLNAVEHRRRKVQQKLLEHTAAVIYMTGPSSPCNEASMSQQTPPRSPQKLDFGPERREVESIRVYADSGVASLLASIEKEIGVLADSTTYDGY